jgi:molecular chaperone GrpE
MAEEPDKTEPVIPADEQASPQGDDAARAPGGDHPHEGDQESDPQAEHIAALEAEAERLKEMHNKAILAAADYDNAAKRAQREMQETRKFASVGLARDLLPVVDNLRRALSTVPPEAAEESEQLKALVTGVEMIERELLAVFERHNIEVIIPQDDPFDPHLHEAMFEAPDAERPDGTIAQVLQPGYRLHDRLLRPAQVVVAKGGKQNQGAPEAPPGPEEIGGRVDTKA